MANAGSSSDVSNSGNSSSTASTSNSGNSSSNSSAQGGTAQQEANNAGNSQNITFNSTTPAKQTVRAAPAIAAPSLTTTLTETCMGSTSLGLTVIGWGASGGSTWRDSECVRRLNARELAQTIGDREAAREVLCGNGDVFRAYQALGRPCALRPNGDRNPDYVPDMAANYLPQPLPPAGAAPPPPPPPPPPAAMEPVPNPGEGGERG